MLYVHSGAGGWWDWSRWLQLKRRVRPVLVGGHVV